MADKAAGVPEFFAGRDIFVTGTSGVVGKPFVEKLLRSCPDVGRVYVLLRAKKGKTVEERLKKMKELKVRKIENPVTCTTNVVDLIFLV